jgi:PLP dependent protein
VPSSIAANLADVRARIERAARDAGRDPASIRLVAISKTFPLEAVAAAARAGQHDVGENRVQEALQKIHRATELHIRWHLVGHLQSNKIRKAAAVFDYIHSIDSVDVLRRVDQAAGEAGTSPQLLVQVDLAGEVTKHGAGEAEVVSIVEAAGELKAARLVGLMLLPPFTENPEDARPWFKQLRHLRDRLIDAGAAAERLGELSMGMSHDFEVAVQEGATMVRVGTAIFGERPSAGGSETRL